MATLQDEENRQPVPLAEVPPHVVNAILAVEDAGFWIHDGYDVRGMLRAFRANVDSGGISQGGSTITQQLVKLEVLTSEQTLDRKVQEIVLAQRLEQQMSKEEILDRYLNTVYFGNHAYGVQAAAETYFGVGVQQLDVGQAAMLAGIIRNPIQYNPVRYPERAAQRRDVALGRMHDAGVAHRGRGDVLAGGAHRAELPPDPAGAQRLLPVRGQGPAAQRPRSSPCSARPTPSATRPCSRAGCASTRPTTPSPSSRRSRRATRSCPWRTAWCRCPGSTPPPASRTAPRWGWRRSSPSTGAVRTMVGGPGFDNYQYNLATQNTRGVGSSFKTFVLATIMEQGYSPDDMINGLAPCTFKNGRQEPYEVNNFADGGGSMGSITAATLASSNCAFVRMGYIAGMPNVAEMAYRLGIPRERPDADGDGQPEPTICATCPSSALGTAGITPLEMASAYATIANDGVYNRPYLVDRIEDRDGNVIYQHAPAPEQRIAPDVGPAGDQRAPAERAERHRHPRPDRRPACGGQDRHEPGLT